MINLAKMRADHAVRSLAFLEGELSASAPKAAPAPPLAAEAPSETAPAARKRRSMPSAERKPPAVVPEPTPAPEEPPVVQQARARIRRLLDQATPDGTPKAMIGLVLAIVSQETGHQSAANMLIDQYQLERIGLAKQEKSD